MMEYACGLAFSPDHRKVVLIRKNRPSWQAGLLNGVGGKIEPGETALDAMVREFREETGVTVPAAAWRPVAVLQGPDFRVSFFAATLGDVWECRSTTDEAIVIAPTLPLPTATMANLQWLVPLALDTSVATPVMVFHPSTNTSTRSPLARLLRPEPAVIDQMAGQMQSLVRRVGTHARCENCGWSGDINDMTFRGMYPDRCPTCDSQSCTLTDEAPA